MKVLLVDDEPLIRTGLRAILDAEPDLKSSARPTTARRSRRSCAGCDRT